MVSGLRRVMWATSITGWPSARSRTIWKRVRVEASRGWPDSGVPARPWQPGPASRAAADHDRPLAIRRLDHAPHQPGHATTPRKHLAAREPRHAPQGSSAAGPPSPLAPSPSSPVPPPRSSCGVVANDLVMTDDLDGLDEAGGGPQPAPGPR